MFDVVLEFNEAGGLTSLDYVRTKFAKAEWDFTNHKPLPGQEGSINKKVSATYYYNDIEEGSPDFDKDKYFISSFDTLQFYNAKTNKPTTDGKSYLHYMDSVRLTKANENDSLANLKDVTYTPSTALDLWQYGPTKSSNEDVIAHLPTDRYDQMTACGIGDSNVTFTNHTLSTGTAKTITINVSATQKFHSMYLNGNGGDPVTSASSANIIAGESARFKVGVTPSSAPVIFQATVDPTYEDLLKVTSTTGGYLCLDASGAKDIKTAVTVDVKLESEWFDPDVTEKYEIFSFTIIPAAVSPVGTWQMEGTTSSDPVIMTFTETEYTGKVSSGFEGAKIGTITDTIGDITDTFKFYYVFEAGQLYAKLYEVDIKSSNEWSKDPLDFGIEFYYEASSDRYGVCLYEATYDSSYEGIIYYSIYGVMSSDGYALEYAPFARK